MKHVKVVPPYDHPSQAYQHLLEFVENPNVPREAPCAFVTVYYRESVNFLNYRAYESFEAISRFMNPNVFSSNVIVSINHFKTVYRPIQARKMYRLITGNRLTDVTINPFEAVWAIFQKSKITRMKAKLKNKGNSFLFDLKGLAEAEVKFPKQCKVIIAALIDGQQSAYDMNELKILSASLHKFGLKTKQPPFSILQYYLPQLYDKGYVEYPRKSYNNEEDGVDRDD